MTKKEKTSGEDETGGARKNLSVWLRYFGISKGDAPLKVSGFGPATPTKGWRTQRTKNPGSEGDKISLAGGFDA